MSTLKVEHLTNCIVVTISRPDALNALNSEILDELLRVIQEAIQNKNIHGIVITGEGEKAFVAGADIKELISLKREEALKLAQKGQKIFKTIEDSPKPVIAAIAGFALGGGCELAMACHIRLATESSKLGQPEVNLGLIPGYGGTQRLSQLIGRGKALELILTGDMISAQEAKSLGLVNHVLPTKEEVMTLAFKIITKISTKSPLAIRYAIKSVNAGFGFEEAGYTAEAENFAACTTTNDFKEGTSAFIEKRQAKFKGE
jgi:enoyl-CoA hydratase